MTHQTQPPIRIEFRLATLAGGQAVMVMYAGRKVEEAGVDDLFAHPLHPYTRGLIASVPSRNARGARLAQIPGMAPSLLVFWRRSQQRVSDTQPDSAVYCTVLYLERLLTRLSGRMAAWEKCRV